MRDEDKGSKGVWEARCNEGGKNLPVDVENDGYEEEFERGGWECMRFLNLERESEIPGLTTHRADMRSDQKSGLGRACFMGGVSGEPRGLGTLLRME